MVSKPILWLEADSTVGIGGNTNPDSTLTVLGSGHYTTNLLVDGKITATGGVDTPYISFSAETRSSIVKRSKGLKEDQVVMQFWNKFTKQIEIYHVKEKRFYNINGGLLK